MLNGEVLDWLRERSSKFGDLEQREIKAVLEFTLLWSFFELKVMKNNASIQKFECKVEQWRSNEQLHPESFAPELFYFKQRYFPDGRECHRFNGLRFRCARHRNEGGSCDVDCPENCRDRRKFVERVLCGENRDPRDDALALLIIVYRLRNNLFHGVKWDYGLEDQEENFNVAGRVLRKAVEIDERVKLQAKSR